MKRNWLDKIGFTWDGLPISIYPPHGAAVLVYRRVEDHPIEVLLLHRFRSPAGGRATARSTKDMNVRWYHTTQVVPMA